MDAEKMMMQRRIDNLQTHIDYLYGELRNCERKLNAAISDMDVVPVCAICIHKEEKDALIEQHDFPSQCMNCITERSQFVWRGLVKENGGAEDEG